MLAQSRSGQPRLSLQHPPCRDLWVARDLVELEDRLAARVERRQHRPPLVTSTRGENCFHLAMRALLVDAFDELQRYELGLPNRTTQRRPELRL